VAILGYEWGAVTCASAGQRWNCGIGRWRTRQWRTYFVRYRL